MNRTRHFQSGFTLIEIVIVVTIISIIASFAAISINVAVGDKQRLDNAAEHLSAAVEVAAEEALLSGHPIGIKINRNGFNYEILQQGKWQAHERARMFAPYELDDDLVLITNGPGSASTNYRPDIVLLPDGERLLQAVSLADQQSDQALNLLPYNGSYTFQEVGR